MFRLQRACFRLHREANLRQSVNASGAGACFITREFSRKAVERIQRPFLFLCYRNRTWTVAAEHRVQADATQGTTRLK